MELPVKELIGVAAAILVAAIGWSQWKRTKRSGRFIEDRESAYNEIWQALEEAHLYVRQDRFEQAGFDARVTAANTLLIRRALHVADDDRAATAAYIDALNQFGVLMSRVEVSPDARRRFATTAECAPIPPELFESVLAIQQTRGEVMARFRRAIGSGQI